MSIEITLPRVGYLRSGLRNAITDVGNITVGHVTLSHEEVQTGVTVIRPHSSDALRDKVPAASAIINGFGKSVGLMQLDELGQLETPIALTNTFSVPAVSQSQIAHCIRANPEVGRSLSTVNPLVLECNDGFLNDIQRMAVTADHYEQAYAQASKTVAQGAVGAGRGMSSFDVKGGIGTASRIAVLNDGSSYTVGALVLANFGIQRNFMWGGRALGQELSNTPSVTAEKGSIIMVLATDAPLDARQLKRLAWRAAAGLARTGSVFGHGSGDIALAFSTAYTLPYLPQLPMPKLAMVHEQLLDGLFQAAADSVEQSILNALWHAESVTGRAGNHRIALREWVALNSASLAK